MKNIDATDLHSYLKEACQLDRITIIHDPVVDERQIRATKWDKLFAESYDFGVSALSIAEDINYYFYFDEPRTKESCDQCKFFSSTGDFGICRRFPPPLEGDGVTSKFPTVYTGDWCGEFQST